jgi:hypothetical protein
MPLINNAQVSTSAAGIPKLAGAAANISPPTEKDMAQYGGIVRHVVRLEPGTDIAPGDVLTITAWGDHDVSRLRPYHVLSADPAGNWDLTVIRAVIGERVQR